MHVGGVRTAIYAWLFARKHNGTFILRIEDTDKNREVEGSIEHIKESLQWLGLNWDEGPYLQSDRLLSYKKYAEILLQKGHAYPDPYTEEEVEVFRKKAEADKRPFLYRDHRPEHTSSWDGKTPLRFKVQQIKRYTWNDIVRGELTAGEEALDDFILLKGDGYPTYNFAHIIDDLEMGVTHIIRGEEFISSTPKFLSLYDALEIARPHIATVPVILGPDGKKKLSKRDGAKDILDYRKEGFLAEALINFLSLLGWHPEGEQEILTVDELINLFDLERVQKGGAKFDEVKLRWFNHEHLRRMEDGEFVKRMKEFLQTRGEEVPENLMDIADLMRERYQTLAEAADALKAGEFDFLQDNIAYDASLLTKGAKVDAETARKNLEEVAGLLLSIPDELYSEEGIKDVIFPYATAVGRAGVLRPMRVALSGKEKSPDPFILAALLGKNKAIERINLAQKMLK